MLTMEFSSFWDIIAIPFGYIMQGFNFICGGNYVLSLFLFALVVKVLTLPLSIKQQKNMIKGAALRPKMMLIEKKYAGRRDQPTLQKKQQEMMELQQREGYSPLAGCLPLLIQFPILIALYRIIRMPLKYVCNLKDQVIVDLFNNHKSLLPDGDKLEVVEKLKRIPSYSQIDMVSLYNRDSSLIEGILDPEKLPNFNLFGRLNLGVKPSFSPEEPILWWLILIPVLCCALSYLSMWIGRKVNKNSLENVQQSDPSQRASSMMMNLTMPLMSLWIAFIAPAAVGIYWIYTSLLGILQTLLLAKIMPLPQYTEEEIRTIQRAMKEQKQERNVVGRSVDANGKPKSLHYADDEDEY